MIVLTVMAAQALSVSDLSPSRFYVMGVQQGMTVVEYNALIANGGFISKPVQPDTYWASIDGQEVFVTFCRGVVVRAVANYKSSDWMKSLTVLESIGFSWGRPFVSVDGNNTRSGKLGFSVITPSGFSYFVGPMIKGLMLLDKDYPSFQLNFESVDNPCR